MRVGHFAKFKQIMSAYSQIHVHKQMCLFVYDGYYIFMLVHNTGMYCDFV